MNIGEKLVEMSILSTGTVLEHFMNISWSSEENKPCSGTSKTIYIPIADVKGIISKDKLLKGTITDDKVKGVITKDTTKGISDTNKFIKGSTLKEDIKGSTKNNNIKGTTECQ